MRVNKQIKKLALYFLVFLIVSFTLFPIYWIFTTSLKPKKEILGNFELFPKHIYVKNYTNPFVKGPYLKYLENSLIVASLNTLLVLLLAVPTTYAFSRLSRHLYGAKHWFFWLITNRMAPPAAFILPLFSLAVAIHLLDTQLVLILVYCVFNLPFAIWLLKGMIDGIPEEIDDAALIDGCSIWGVLGRIVVPLAKSGIAATALLVWLFAWNEYLFAMILTVSRARTLPTGLTEFVTVVGIKYGEMAAVSMVSMVPAFLFLFFVQRYLVTGLTFGAVKE